MTTLLIIHIAIATVTALAATTGLVAAWRRSSATKTALYAMWTSFGGVAITGVMLIAVSPQALTHTCALMSVYVIGMTAVHVYAVKQKQALLV